MTVAEVEDETESISRKTVSVKQPISVILGLDIEFIIQNTYTHMEARNKPAD